MCGWLGAVLQLLLLGLLPAPVAGQCSANFTVANGFVTYLQSNIFSLYSPGTIATLFCNLGYWPSGAVSSTCTGSGWSPTTLGTCNSIFGSTTTCADITNTSGTVTYFPLGSPHSQFATATLWCPLGTLPQGNVLSSCTNGDWSPGLGRCVSVYSDASVTCPDEAAPSGGAFLFVQSSLTIHNAEGTTRQVICTRGYAAQGDTYARCEKDPASPTGASWSNPVTNCTVASPTNGSCPAITVNQGTVIYDLMTPREPGTTATLACNLGYVPVESCFLSCMDNGTWSGNFQCDPVGIPTNSCVAISRSNAIVTYDIFRPRAVDTLATLVCFLGYTTQGPSVASCTAGGANGTQWSETLGECVPFYSQPTCPLITVSNGIVAYDLFKPRQENTQAVLTCFLGFKVNGTSATECKEVTAGSPPQWTDSLGSCVSAF